MSAFCPSCGQLIRKFLSADELMTLLRDGKPKREVYKGQGGGWFVTYGGGEVPDRVVRGLVAEGKIQSVYSNCPNDAYHIGKTWDVERTLEARKRLGKAAPDYYVGDA